MALRQSLELFIEVRILAGEQAARSIATLGGATTWLEEEQELSSTKEEGVGYATRPTQPLATLSVSSSLSDRENT